MGKIVNIFEALIMIAGAIWMFLYYSGRLNYSGEPEERRKKKVEKYGKVILLCGFLCLIGATTLIIATLIGF